MTLCHILPERRGWYIYIRPYIPEMTEVVGVKKKRVGRRLGSIEDNVDKMTRKLHKKNKERVFMATRNSTNNTRINKTTITGKQK